MAGSQNTNMSAQANVLTSYDRAERAARFIRTRASAEVSVGVVLGSGLGAFAEDLEKAVFIRYGEIPGFAHATVEGHAGRLAIGTVAQVAIAAMQGRFHFYEGYPLEDVTFPIRVLKLLGVRTLILTNASGALNVEFTPGSLMVITDHINLMGVNPLIGPNDKRFGPRFPDLTNSYSPELQDVVLQEARSMGMQMFRGVYASLTGPSYE